MIIIIFIYLIIKSHIFFLKKVSYKMDISFNNILKYTVIYRINKCHLFF